jgi:predicted ferric reductase
MTQIKSIFSQIGLFFKDTFQSVPKIFNWEFLKTPLSGPSQYGLVYIIILVIIVIFGLTFQTIIGRRTYPKFYKKFLYKIAAFLIYIPVILIFLNLIIISGINLLTNPIYSVATVAIWLIWFLYLVYYRVVIVKRYWVKYKTYKKEENYLKNGKTKS